MNFTLIICTYNRPILLQKTILSIYRQNFPIKNLEILIVDNNPPYNKEVVNKLKNQLRGLNIKYLSEKKQGISYASNLALKRASNDMVIFIDDDELLIKNLCKNYEYLWQRYKRREVKMIGGLIKPIFASAKAKRNFLNNRTRFFANNWIFGTLNLGKKEYELKYPDSLFSGNFSFDRHFVLERGGFDNNLGRQAGHFYLYGHDVELCWRFLIGKEKIIYSPRLIVNNLITEEKFDFNNFFRRYFLSAIEINYIEKKIFGTDKIRKNSICYLKELVKDVVHLRFNNIFCWRFIYKVTYIGLTIFVYLKDIRWFGRQRTVGL